MIYDLKNLTFIIPVRIESKDRLANFKIVIKYLLENLNTNIIIFESGKISEIREIIKDYSNIRHIFNYDPSPAFHRTKFLNAMLNMVSTGIVVNYDIDVLLPVRTYIDCCRLIEDGAFDLIFPYFFGFSQKQVLQSGRDKLARDGRLEILAETDIKTHNSQYGHCQFFKTSVYREGGGQNEGFVSYGPEDQEIGYRFAKLGYKLHWYNGWVYHLEHSRGQNSGSENPFFVNNVSLFEYIKSLSAEELKRYYSLL